MAYVLLWFAIFLGDTKPAHEYR